MHELNYSYWLKVQVVSLKLLRRPHEWLWYLLTLFHGHFHDQRVGFQTILSKLPPWFRLNWKPYSRTIIFLKTRLPVIWAQLHSISRFYRSLHHIKFLFLEFRLQAISTAHFQTQVFSYTFFRYLQSISIDFFLFDRSFWWCFLHIEFFPLINRHIVSSSVQFLYQVKLYAAFILYLVNEYHLKSLFTFYSQNLPSNTLI